MYFWVEQKHIDKGEKESPTRCPIALCMQEAGFPNVGVSDVEVSLDRREILKKWIPLPEEAMQFIADFDLIRGDCYEKEVPRPEPFSFELDVEVPK